MKAWTRHICLVLFYLIGTAAALHFLFAALAIQIISLVQLGPNEIWSWSRFAFVRSMGAMVLNPAFFFIPAALLVIVALAIRLISGSTVSWPSIALGLFGLRLGAVLVFGASAAINTTESTDVDADAFNMRNPDFWSGVLFPAVLLGLAFWATYWVRWILRDRVGLKDVFPSTAVVTAP
ncbi:MAG: hypothetical protein AAGA88_09505 [Pseudomonadota bacterium]